jgi:heme/copper-type cytochrome/quinol oxidase subunit 2
VPDILNGVVFLIVGLAVLAFLWGIVKYLMSGGDSKQLEESKKFMLWGIVGITIMVSVWGIISILGNIFGINVSHTPGLPEFE